VYFILKSFRKNVKFKNFYVESIFTKSAEKQNPQI